jgi:hypothetical protein
MKKNKKWLYIAGLFYCVVGCKTYDPSVCDSTPSKIIFKCIANLKRNPADFGGAYFDIKNQGVAFICANCRDKIDQMNLAVTTLNNAKPYKYYVWGQIFECTNCPTLAPGSVKFIYVDKIESSN